MKRTVSAFVLATAVGGCMSPGHNQETASVPTVRASGEYVPQKVPGVTGPWGEPIPMAAPYTSAPPVNAYQAKQMMSQSVPLSWVQMDQQMMQASAQMAGMPMPPNGMPMMQPPGGMLSPPGVPFSPPMMTPGGGGMPSPNMPMPGVRPAGNVAGAMPVPGAMPGGRSYSIGRTQVRFTGPDGMRVAWLTQGADGKPSYSAPVVEAPGRYNFTQASIYRLKLSNIRGRPGLEVYPTLEVVPANPKTDAFLAHSAVPLEFTPEDFKEIAEGKYLVKVIYLPDPQFQELAVTGIDQIISTRLNPGEDPILEAQRRGSILLVIRMGNVDQEAPNTPSLDGSAQGQAAVGMMPSPGMAGPMPAMPGPMGPGNATAGPAVPPALRTGPAQPTWQPGASPGPAMPGLPSNPVPASPPALRGATSQLSGGSEFRPVSTLQTLPDLPSRTASGPQAPVPPAPSEASSVLPPLPPNR